MIERTQTTLSVGRDAPIVAAQPSALWAQVVCGHKSAGPLPSAIANAGHHGVLLSLAADAERLSEHPLASAVLTAGRHQGLRGTLRFGARDRRSGFRASQ
ncbi:MAG: hypothetical protein QOH97_5541 [Actinoplanes sp.]|nr:hypothetical protein [Actinoplanes sp.]